MKQLLTLAMAIIAAGTLSASAADSKANYEKGCAKCHGKDGKGDTAMGKKLAIKDYSDAKVQAELKDDEMFKAIKDGVKNNEGKQVMKAAEGLSDDDIKDIVKYVRSLKK